MEVRRRSIGTSGSSPFAERIRVTLWRNVCKYGRAEKILLHSCGTNVFWRDNFVSVCILCKCVLREVFCTPARASSCTFKKKIYNPVLSKILLRMVPRGFFWEQRRNILIIRKRRIVIVRYYTLREKKYFGNEKCLFGMDGNDIFLNLNSFVWIE